VAGIPSETLTAYQGDDGLYSSKAMVLSNHDNVENYHVVLDSKVSCMFDVAAKTKAVVNA
jgi:hypothetical protein